MKILELYYDGTNEEEQYFIKIEKGVSKLQATAHLLRSIAEGLIEIQTELLPIKEVKD